MQFVRLVERKREGENKELTGKNSIKKNHLGFPINICKKENSSISLH